MGINYAAALLAGLAMTSGQAPANPSFEGLWGGRGAVLTVNPDGAAILQQDCASGRFGPVRMSKAGGFRAQGSWEEHAAGPQAADVPPALAEAMFEGRVSGDTLTLKITRKGHPRQDLTLLKGKRAKLIRCL